MDRTEYEFRKALQESEKEVWGSIKKAAEKVRHKY